VNKTLTILTVLLATSAAFGSKIKTVKEPTAQLELMYRHCPSEPERAAIRNRAGVSLVMEIDRTPNYSDEVSVPAAHVQAALKSFAHSGVDVESITSSDLPTKRHPIKRVLLRLRPDWIKEIYSDPGFITQ
jgi:hypothetical protein